MARPIIPVAGAAAAAALALAAGAAPADAAAARPNVLIVLTDDQRSAPPAWMPETTRFFGRHGRRYERFFAASPLCCPARASLMTGLYPHNHGILRNASPLAAVAGGWTMQRYLDRAGYRTGIVGKYLNRWPAGEAPPHFDRYAVTDSQSYTDAPFEVDGRRRIARGYITTWIGGRAISTVRRWERHDRRPWFLIVAPTAPHWPYSRAPRDMGVRVRHWAGNPATHERALADKPRPIRTHGRVWIRRGAAVRARQLVALREVDRVVGRIGAALGRLRERRRTLAIFLSDNGYLWGDHRWVGKEVPYTPSVSVPMFLRWPGHVRHGRTRRLASTVDLLPTVLDAARVRTRPGRRPDGRSLLRPDRRRRVFMEYFHQPSGPASWASLRGPRRQYVEYRGADGELRFREEYDLRRDPWQLRNVLADGRRGNARASAALRERLADARRCRGRGCP